jgi:S1-C subfamily serine protease
MAETEDWNIPAGMRPDQRQLPFNLGEALLAVVGLRAEIPSDAFTASILGTERSGSGVHIADGLVATIGYLITEAAHVWLTTGDGRGIPGHVAGYDHETGFGLIQALGPLDLPLLPLGSADKLEVGAPVVIAGCGGAERALKAAVIAAEPFTGYWEYQLERALFTAPSYPSWSGAAAIDQDGALVGIGSLHVERPAPNGRSQDVNMFVPIDLLRPIFRELVSFGRPNRPARPWLGMYTIENNGRLVVAGLADKGPAARARVQTGDVVAAVNGRDVRDLGALYRTVWDAGSAGVDITLSLQREGRRMEAKVTTADRHSFMKKPRLH